VHGMPTKNANTSEKKPVNPFAVGGGFIDYCVKQGWMIQEGNSRHAKYYVTKIGEEKTKKEFGIKI
jgi:hypothetical protein